MAYQMTESVIHTKSIFINQYLLNTYLKNFEEQFKCKNLNMSNQIYGTLYVLGITASVLHLLI